MAVIIDANTRWPFEVDSPVVILPFYGEFGHFVNSFVRQVHHIRSTTKVVCCKRGEEIYFPSATDFYYEWADPFKPNQKVGFRDRWPPPSEFVPIDDEIDLISRLGYALPGHEIVYVAQPLTDDQVRGMAIGFEIPPLPLPRCDVVACCRRRDWDSYRNFDRWRDVLEPLSSSGLAVGVVGESATSYDFEFLDFRSWVHRPHAPAVLYALSTARIFIGTDTGPTHLAALVSPALLLFRNEACPYHNYIREVVSPVALGRGASVGYEQNGWNRPDSLVEAAKRFLAVGSF